MARRTRLLLAALLLLASRAPTAQSVDVPQALEGWQKWALDGREHARCPYVSGQDPARPEARICAWSGPVEIDGDAKGATFSQHVRVFAPSWVPLPGGPEYWPQDTRVDGAPLAVVEREGRPQARLDEGEYTLSGRFAWSEMPESIPVPYSTGLVKLRVNGRDIAVPERSGDALRLGTARRVGQADQLELHVYRLLVDSLPGSLTTRFQFRVAGQAREAVFESPLPDGFVPMRLQGPLPARLQPDGRLRVQLRPGAWTLELLARAPAELGVVKVPGKVGSAEVWSYESVDELRVTALEGVPGVDPSQANVPADWAGFPAFAAQGGAQLRVVERSRGMAGQDLNEIRVERELWRDFEGNAYTFRDRVAGRMQQGWRLDVTSPYQLLGAREGGQPLLVTDGGDGRTGVEVRSPSLDLEAIGRTRADAGGLPAAGWSQRVASLAVMLHLPPAHRLLAAPGADQSRSAWINQWRLLDLFVVLLVAAAVLRVAGWQAAVLALAALVLSHQELRALTWILLNLVIAIALWRAVPAGRLQFAARVYRDLSLALAVLVFIPFALLQARLALFPQLESSPVMPMELRETAAVPAPEQAMQKMEATVVSDAAGPPQLAAPPPPAAAPVPAREAEPPRYAPGVLLQSGPGIPEWQYQSHRLEWGGPVEPRQTLRLVVLTPLWMSAWRLLAIILLASLLAVLARRVIARPGWPLLDRWFGTGSAVALMLVLSLACPATVQAQTPAPSLIEELGRRLSRPPACAPDCVAIPAASVSLEGGRLEAQLEVHALDRVAVLLPRVPERWEAEAVLVDGRAARGLSRDASGQLTVALDAGVHTISVAGVLPETDALRVEFPQRPARIRVTAPGWEISGVEDGRLLADSLTLTRVAEAQVSDATAATATEEFPPFVRVTRNIEIDLDWRVTTRVERLAPAQSAFTLELPLLPGEAVLTDGMQVRGGRVTVAIPASAGQASWISSLRTASALQLDAPKSVPWSETWRIAVSPTWHVSFSGSPEVFPASADGSRWVHSFQPRPGESLKLEVSRPAGVPGPTAAIERVRQEVRVGRRSSDTALLATYRSTQGGRQVLQLPEGVRLQSVLADGQPLALRAEGGQLSLPLQPGVHSFQVTWQTDRGTGLLTRPGATSVGSEASNVTTSLELPESRWVLFASGGGVGPAILYWAELAVFIVVAVLLGRFGRTPLKTHEWLLVGLGLSTFSWGVLLLFAAWVFVLDWRSRWNTQVPDNTFNAVQVAVAALTIVALGSLLSAIPNGLLGWPDMRIAGPDSSARLLTWFHDRVSGELPQPVVVSVSIWYYKAAMLAWALWLSFALVRWVRWAWLAFSAPELWRRHRRS